MTAKIFCIIFGKHNNSYALSVFNKSVNYFKKQRLQFLPTKKSKHLLFQIFVSIIYVYCTRKIIEHLRFHIIISWFFTYWCFKYSTERLSHHSSRMLVHFLLRQVLKVFCTKKQRKHQKLLFEAYAWIEKLNCNKFCA